MRRDRAAYMREYRARTRAPLQGPPELAVIQEENERLAAEVARLKRLLAGRTIDPPTDRVAAAMQEFRPVPKIAPKRHA